ncbi:MAG: alpha/beta hydrolase [Dehalococcoidia bacterium]
MPDRAITIHSGDVALAGSLSGPPGADAPLVICVHGSGPLDRDQNMPEQRLDIFNTIARFLEGRGVASLRYDKRGTGASTGDYWNAGHFDLLDDLLAVIGYARDQGHRVVYLLGHSEGTLLAAEASVRRAVDGLILVSPFVQDLEPTLRMQARRLEEALAAMPGWQARCYRVLARLSGGPVKAQDRLIRRLKSTTDASFGRGQGRVPARALREMLGIEVDGVYRTVRVPTLLLGGAKDLQCDPGDVQEIAAILGPLATPVVVPDLTHILRKDPGEHTFNSYAALIREPMAPEVCERIGSWLATRHPLIAGGPA